MKNTCVDRLIRTTVAVCCFLSVAAGVVAAQNEDLAVDYYGYFKVDMAYDSAPSSHGNFVMYVKPHPQGQTVGTVNITARQTRLGLKIQRGSVSGRIEFDFYGGGTENKNLPLLRKAYIDVPLGGVNLRAGQASDLMSPLVPTTLNYTVAWGAGNIGYRRPLVQIWDQTGPAYWGFAIARNISSDLNGDTVLDGDASCVPVLQGRFGYDIGSATVGLSGHYGLMKSEGATKDQYNTYSGSVDFKATLGNRLAVLAEAYLGANTAAYFGSGLNGDCVHDLESRGGWVNLQFAASDRVDISVGYGIDDLINELSTAIATHPDARNRNTMVFANLRYAILPDVTTGLELSRWETNYINLTAGNDPHPIDTRLQWSLQTGF